MARIDAVLIQAVIAGALSFAHLHEIAEAAGQTGWKAWAYPISVDLLLVAAWRRIHIQREAGHSAALPWLWFVIALAASLGANIGTAGMINLDDVPQWLSILVAGWPALAFFGGTLLAHTPARPEATEDTPPIEVEQLPAETPAQPTDPRPELTAANHTEPEPAPPPPDTTPEPDPAPAPAPAVSVPPGLVAHAQQIADSHRQTTGTSIDPDTLSARLNLPAPMIHAITAQLT
nr:DUF2637 domain-containing protein [Streptomyces spiramenti]